MTNELQTSLISAGVGIVVALIGSLITWRQMRVNAEAQRQQLAHDRERVKSEIEAQGKQLQFAIESEQARNQAERLKWLTELKTAYAVELYKKRLEVYPQVFEMLAKISHAAPQQPTPEMAHQLARELNEWFYSVGGMCAETSTRGAILGLRQSLDGWGVTGHAPHDLYRWRNVAMMLLRRDLDLIGLESFREARDEEPPGTLLARLENEIMALEEKAGASNRPTSFLIGA